MIIDCKLLAERNRSWKRRAQPTECGTFRYCSACGAVPVALKHTETRCYACQQDNNDTKRGDDASEME